MQIMFDWCEWEWNLRGKYGVWDDDFRFESYSLGIITHATTNVDLSIGFDPKLPVDAASSRFFKECLHPTEQIQVQL